MSRPHLIIRLVFLLAGILTVPGCAIAEKIGVTAVEKYTEGQEARTVIVAQQAAHKVVEPFGESVKQVSFQAELMMKSLGSVQQEFKIFSHSFKLLAKQLDDYIKQDEKDKAKFDMNIEKLTKKMRKLNKKISKFQRKIKALEATIRKQQKLKPRSKKV